MSPPGRDSSPRLGRHPVPGHQLSSSSVQRCRSTSGLRENTPPASSEDRTNCQAEQQGSLRFVFDGSGFHVARYRLCQGGPRPARGRRKSCCGTPVRQDCSYAGTQQQRGQPRSARPYHGVPGIGRNAARRADFVD